MTIALLQRNAAQRNRYAALVPWHCHNGVVFEDLRARRYDVSWNVSIRGDVNVARRQTWPLQVGAAQTER